LVPAAAAKVQQAGAAGLCAALLQADSRAGQGRAIHSCFTRWTLEAGEAAGRQCGQAGKRSIPTGGT
jgi:hypothetical protein